MSESTEPVTWPVGFRRHLRVETADDEVYLFADHQVTVLRGAHITALAPFLDGTHTIPALVGDPPANLTADEVSATIQKLAESGLVGLRRPKADDVEGSALAYWASAGLDPVGTGRTGVDGRVRLIPLGDVDSRTTALALREAAITVVGSDSDADLSVVLCTDYLDPRLADVDAEHRATSRPWLLAKPGGTQPWIGPVFQSGGGCWRCLADRLRRHRPVDAILAQTRPGEQPIPRPLVAIAPLATAVGGLITLEATKWLAGYRYSGQRAVLTFDSLDLHTRQHALRARPQCAHCGNPSMMRELADRPVELTPQIAVDTSGGGYRVRPPEEILARYEHLVSPVTGIIKGIRRDTRGPAFFNVFWSGPNVAIGGQHITTLRSSLRAESGGKGVTPLHAEVGALCEAVERYCGAFHGDEKRIRGSLHTLGEQAIHPNTCQLFHERQYQDRIAWNNAHGPFQRVSKPFDEGAVTDWTPVWSLTEKRHRLLPTALLYYDAPHGRVRADSNGTAAGGSLEDAILQGLLELVERDAVALWWYNRTRAPGVDLDAIADPWIEQLRTVHAGLGRTVWALDITADLRIPTIVAMSRRTDGPHERIVFGFGAHIDFRIAVRRALTELNQMMPAVIELSDNDNDADNDADGHDPDAIRWWREATVRDQPHLLPDPTRPTSHRTEVVGQPDVTTDIRMIQQRLTAIGLELLVLDQTRPDVGLPVARVIVPGLRHFWARLGPGRLYDVPVRLGLVDEPTPYEELNPVPLFM